MKLAIMQPYFFPYIGYFQLIYSVDKFMLYENVTFRKKSWITRNYIQQKNNKPFMCSIPIKEKSSFKYINEIKIVDFYNWKQWFVKVIYNSYRKATFFDESYYLIEGILAYQHNSLHNFNCMAIINICNHLDIKTTISTNHTAYIKMEKELQLKFQQNSIIYPHSVNTIKTSRIINICKNEHANTYVNAINGINIYKKDDFLPYRIYLKYIQSESLKYKQFSKNFTPNLSIIDVLMHCGKKRTKKLLNAYNFI